MDKLEFFFATPDNLNELVEFASKVDCDTDGETLANAFNIKDSQPFRRRMGSCYLIGTPCTSIIDIVAMMLSKSVGPEPISLCARDRATKNIVAMRLCTMQTPEEFRQLAKVHCVQGVPPISCSDMEQWLIPCLLLLRRFRQWLRIRTGTRL